MEAILSGIVTSQSVHFISFVERFVDNFNGAFPIAEFYMASKDELF